MSAIDRERLRCEDTCPVCGDGIDWEEGDHVPHAWTVLCLREQQFFDVAVLEMQHLND